jgi:hypothetical protein
MRENMGLAMTVGVVLYCAVVLALIAFAKPCEVCCRLTVRTARLIGVGRRIRACGSCRCDLKRKGLLRTKPSRRHRHQSTQPKRRTS